MQNNNLKLLIEAKEAYHFASFSRIISRVLKKSSFRFKSIVVFLGLLVVSPIVLVFFPEIHPYFFLSLMLEILFLLILFYSLELELKKSYTFIHNKYSEEFIIYKKNRLYFRYLIFRSKLLNEIKISIDNIENIQILLEKENIFFNISIFKQYPTITVLLVILTALINGMAGQTYLWKNGVLFITFYLVILLLFLSFFFAESFKSRDYYHKELDLFLTWLKNDFDVKAPNKS